MTLNEKERKFLDGKGRDEKYIWMIDDKAVFDLLNAEFSVMAVGLNNDYTIAGDALKDAENALIEYGLSIAPAEIRKILRRESERPVEIREQLIELVVRLDTKTVKA
jgi:hypothetical protein